MKNFDMPTMVRFVDEEKNEYDGIAYNQEIICLCCGSVIPLEEVEILVELPGWISIEL